MPVVQNRFYNNPQIGQAFNNLAQAFMPPSGSDLAGYASANAKRQEAARLAQLFDYAQGAEGFDQSTFDRLGQATGQWTPSQGYYGVDTTATTARRGQDIDAQTALEQTRMREAGELERLYAEPIIAGEGDTVFLPQQTQGATGLDPTLSGVPRPLTESQQKAAERQRLQDEGLLTDEIMLDTILGDRTPVEAVGSDGAPVFMSPGAAVREGATPFDEPSSPGTVRMYRTNDGQIGRTVDGMTDMVTGMPVPADAVIGTISDTSESFGTSELSKAREEILGRRAGVESMTQQVVALDEQLAGANADQTVGIVGSSARVFNDLATQAGAVLRATGIEAPEGLRNVTQYQDTFRSLGVQNAQLQSALLDLAYATAQSREPGRLTEADIDRSLRTIGANLQDPLAMRQVLRGAVDRATRDYRAFEKTMLDAYGDNLNLQPGQFPEISPIDGAAPAPQPDAGAPAADEGDGWVTLPNGVRVRERR